MTQKLFIFMAAIILLSSCSGKLGITKRRYTKGFYVSHCKDKPSVKKQELKKDAVAIQSNTAPDQNQTNQQPIIEQPSQMAGSIAALPKAGVAKPQVAEPQKVTASVVKQIYVDKIPTFKSVLLSAKNELKQKKNADDSKVMLVLMVILCLFPFINLIPVYLHDNDLTANFWVTLLLDFLLIVGVIFALLVVLDVVDLR